MFTVRRIGATIGEEPEIISACESHRDAAIRSLIAEPGARLIVEGKGMIVRYHVDAAGRIVEQSRYSGEGGSR